MLYKEVTWRDSLGSWKVSDKYHPNRHPQQKGKGLRRALYSRKFLQLAKFALPPSFGETAQATMETNLPLLPRTAGEHSAPSVTEFMAAEGWTAAMRPGLGCHREWNVTAQRLQSCTVHPGETHTHSKCLQQALLLLECLVP